MGSSEVKISNISPDRLNELQKAERDLKERVRLENDQVIKQQTEFKRKLEALTVNVKRELEEKNFPAYMGFFARIAATPAYIMVLEQFNYEHYETIGYYLDVEGGPAAPYIMFKKLK